MELTEMLGAKAQEIARRDRFDEVEQIACLERGSSLYIYARTEGELTRETFGVPWHIGCVCMRLRHAEPLLDACTARLEAAGGDYPEETGCKVDASSSAHLASSIKVASFGPATCWDGALGPKHRVHALQGLFQAPEAHFSDLLDLLDRHGIPYSYRSISSYGALFRAEESA